MRLHGCQAIAADPIIAPMDLMLLCNGCFESNIKKALKRRTCGMPKRPGLVSRQWNVSLVTAALMLANLMLAGVAGAAQPGQLFGAPLNFGMSADEASAALGVPLSYVRGRPGDELLLALPNVKGNALAIRSDGLYLQFRKGRLTGWKGDWGTAKPLVVGW
jgi:hypothetical protein